LNIDDGNANNYNNNNNNHGHYHEASFSTVWSNIQSTFF
jgi:hypothetical protein